MDYIDLEKDQSLDFQKFLEGALKIVNEYTVEGVARLDEVKQVVGNWSATFDRSFFKGDNELHIYFSNINEKIKFRFKFKGGKNNIIFDLDKGGEFRDGMISTEFINTSSVINDKFSLLIEKSLSNTSHKKEESVTQQFENHPEFGIVTPDIKAKMEALQEVIKKDDPANDKIDEPVLMDPYGLLKTPITVRSDRRFYRVEELWRDYFLVEFDNHEVVKIMKSDLPKTNYKNAYIPQNNILHYSPTLIAKGNLRINVDQAIELGIQPADRDLTMYGMRLGSWEDHSSEGEGEYVEFIPFQEKRFISIGGWRGHGHQGAGGSQSYMPRSVRKSYSLRETVQRCHCQWLLELIDSKKSDAEIKKAIILMIYKDSERVTPWNHQFESTLNEINKGEIFAVYDHKKGTGFIIEYDSGRLKSVSLEALQKLNQNIFAKSDYLHVTFSNHELILNEISFSTEKLKTIEKDVDLNDLDDFTLQYNHQSLPNPDRNSPAEWSCSVGILPFNPTKIIALGFDDGNAVQTELFSIEEIRSKSHESRIRQAGGASLLQLINDEIDDKTIRKKLIRHVLKEKGVTSLT